VKKKDTLYLVVAVGILLVVGYIIYTQILGNKKTSAASKTVTVEVVGPIPDSFDQDAVATLNNSSKVRDFNSAVDLSGLGNTATFGP
jgi:hypothetical protein